MIKSESTKSILREETIEIKNFQENNKDYLHFGFQNKFTDLDSVTATDVWSKYCDENPDKIFIHIWDCQGMTGFDNSAKTRWMDCMDRYSAQTEKIILISDNILIRGAARLMSKVTKHKLNVYKAVSEMIIAEI